MDLNLHNYKSQKNFSQKHLLGLSYLTEDEIYQILSLALKLKDENKKGIVHHHLKGKTLGMIFEKSSTRTRVSFEVGIYQLGGYGLFLSSSDLQLGRGETIEDTARVLSRYLDGIMIRTYKQEDVENLAKYASIPVINGLTDLLHPCQVLADLMTIYEIKRRFKGLKLAYIGDGNNVAHSLLVGCSKVGMDITVACPEGYEPEAKIVYIAKKNATLHGSNVTITHSPQKAMENADCVYTDVWTSMGQEAEVSARLSAFKEFQVNKELFGMAKENAIFLHCLPAKRGQEVTDDVIDSDNSVVFDQAENRLHAQKAVMVLLMGQQK